ncbi:hypothetical protein HK097_011125 [Rhizophlyctis rosea]|uniref:Uncharacterized protein n=1 Tax=Rhizophlyctis rosea TaxID=64517 RepID=A0AAD5SH31_9FUNG|nr:hypothetical protein HK097_011125 [Rhizophlyctis rosea]
MSRFFDPPASAPNGLPTKRLPVPKILTPLQPQKPLMPNFGPRRVLSKAEKFTTEFVNRKKELEELDQYHENIRVKLNLRETGQPQKPMDVKVVNLDKIQQNIKVVNNGPPPVVPPPKKPTMLTTGTDTDDLLQINPRTQKINTTSTAKVQRMADASTSPMETTPQVPNIGPSVPSADPTQNIVNHYHYHNQFHQYHNQQTLEQQIQNIHNVQTNHNTMVNNNQYNHQENYVANILNYQNVANQNVDPGVATGGPLTQQLLPYQDRLLIEAPVNAPVETPALRHAVRHLPAADELPAYEDVDMNFGGALPELDPPAYKRKGKGKKRLETIVMPKVPPPPGYVGFDRLNKGRPRVPRKGDAAYTAARIIEQQRANRLDRIVQMPTIPASHAYDPRPSNVPELRMRDEGWYMQGLDDAPKPPTKRKGGRMVKDATPKRIRTAY